MLHYQIYWSLIFKYCIKANYVLMLQFFMDLDFPLHSLLDSFLFEFVFIYLFYSNCDPRFMGCEQDLAVRSFANRCRMDFKVLKFDVY